MTALASWLEARGANRLLLHRGPFSGRGVTVKATAPFELKVSTNEGALHTYRRTDVFRDGARIYLPAVMVDDNGKVTR